MPKLTQINVFPIKSCAGIRQSQALVQALGLADDRRWMIVALDTGKFITGRERSELVLLKAQPTSTGLTLHLPGNLPDNLFGNLQIDAHATLSRREVQIWGETVNAACADPECNRALSQWLGQPVELVHFDHISQRQLDQRFAKAADQTAFADGFPVLLITQESLDGLNARLEQPIAMSRFRPNLVISGAEYAHAEDSWRQIQIGDAVFDVVKPCTRCVFTTVDALTGVRDPSGEPLRTLKDYRRAAEGITFGMNLIARSLGTRIQEGDAVFVRHSKAD